MTQIKYPNMPILLVDDEILTLNSAELSLQQEGINNIVTCSDSRDVISILEKQCFSVIVLDLYMPNITGQELLVEISTKFPNCIVLIVTAVNDIDTAIYCMKKGAYDYVLKPLSKDTLIICIRKAISKWEMQNEIKNLKNNYFSDSLKNPDAFSAIVTQNPKMHKIAKYIEAVSSTGHPILITGETGVGKELFAEAVHRVIDCTGKLIPINISGLDDNMFSDALFGHKKGAFTGADHERTGLIAQAKDGTLFMDEIGELSSSSQVKLLRLLQDGKYFQVGSDIPIISQARIVAATNRNLEKQVHSGAFRKDLYYRLQTHMVNIPPLRDRKDDLELLTNYFIEQISENTGCKKPSLPKELISLLNTYSFPGNVRELKSMIFNAISCHTTGILSLSTFKERIYPKQEENVDKTNFYNQSIIDNRINFPEDLPTLKQIENMLIDEALKRSKNNKSLASQMLGIKRQALQNRLRKISVTF